MRVRNIFSPKAAIRAVVAIISLQLTLSSHSAHAAGIRDAEIEHTIRTYASPLLNTAGISQEDFGLHIVNDKALNAFVARGQRIFLTTGLLISADHAGQIIGVLAHEIGHITGGHIARLDGALADARNQALIGQIVGIAVGLLAKDAGVARAAGANIAKNEKCGLPGNGGAECYLNDKNFCTKGKLSRSSFGYLEVCSRPLRDTFSCRSLLPRRQLRLR